MSRLRDIMTNKVVTLNPEMTLREAIGILRAENVNGAPVVHGGQVVGVASDLSSFVTGATLAVNGGRYMV